MVNTGSKVLIEYKMDYDPKEDFEKKRFQINTAGGGNGDYMEVAYAYGESTEFIIRQTFEQLEVGGTLS